MDSFCSRGVVCVSVGACMPVCVCGGPSVCVCVGGGGARMGVCAFVAV